MTWVRMVQSGKQMQTKPKENDKVIYAAMGPAEATTGTLRSDFYPLQISIIKEAIKIYYV